jgi:hypothetical protein
MYGRSIPEKGGARSRIAKDESIACNGGKLHELTTCIYLTHPCDTILIIRKGKYKC